jgi:phage shock protein PspC (stress-responsive transcriptional regulator)
MKKTFHISIAQTLFILEEDAYTKLDGYLMAVREHFKDTPSKDEIVADIEARIAEQLLETRESIITLSIVEHTIERMGTVEDFDDAENIETIPRIKRRIYRDVENKIIAGVCAGLAELFNINVLWVRILFVVLALSNAIGVILYIILWIVLPEAKTVSQKLEMEGSPVTLETLSAAVQDGARTLQKSGSGFAVILRNLFEGIGRFLRTIAGSVFVFGAGVAMAGIMLGSGFVISNTTWIADDIPLTTLLPGVQYWIVLGAMLLSIILVLLCILLAGVALLKRKKVIETWVGFGIFGVWLITLLISGYGMAQIVTNYEKIVSLSPAYQVVTEEISFNEPIQALTMENGMRITIIEGTGTTSTLTVTGRQKIIDSYRADYTNGTLTISPHDFIRKHCVLCHRDVLEFTLTTPSLNTLTLKGRAVADTESLPATSPFTLILEKGSYGDLVLNEQAVDISLTDGSHLKLRGTASTTNSIVRDGSHLDAKNFLVEKSSMEVNEGSYAEINAQNELVVMVKNGSQVRYVGNPRVSEEKDFSSDISPL